MNPLYVAAGISAAVVLNLVVLVSMGWAAGRSERTEPKFRCIEGGKRRG